MRILAIILAVLLAPLAALAEGRQAPDTMIVLDGSGSMWGQIGGTAKVAMARETLGEVLEGLPAQNRLGLMVYGHRRKGDCGDIELAVPVGAGTAKPIADFANAMNPKGKTPLTEAVRRAAKALRYDEAPASVVLITDGIETCDADPCALARELEAGGIGFTAHVVGFGLSREEGRQVACLAEETGGRYFEASDAAGLKRALRDVVLAETPPPPAPDRPEAPLHRLLATASLAEGGPVLEADVLGWSLYPVDGEGKAARRPLGTVYEPRFFSDAPAGRYELEARLGPVTRRIKVELRDGERLDVHLVMQAAAITVVPLRQRGDAEADGEINVKLRVGRTRDSGYGQGLFFMPAGEVQITARLGKAELTRTRVVAAGEALREEIVMATGRIAGVVHLAEGAPAMSANAVRVSVHDAARFAAGRRNDITSAAGGAMLDLPEGRYVLGARAGRAQVFTEPFDLVAGEVRAVTLILEAGMVEITAPGARRIEILGGPGHASEGRRVSRQTGESLSDILPAGQYLARASYGGAIAPVEAGFAIRAGELGEVTLTAP